MPNVVAGQEYSVRDTERNTRNGLLAGKRVFMTHVGDKHFSIYVDQSSEKKLFIEKELFGENFKKESLYISDVRIETAPYTDPYK